MQHIRNFSIIAHIDHGKSTLADRFIQTCGGLSDREMEAQVLDSMDLERERGITIKAQTAALSYSARDGRTYQLNLIDTPGHVDFSYEVSRSLAACEGALLVVDASQGVEAQTVANCYTAIEQGVEVVPVLNKMDLPQADPQRVIAEIEDIIGLPAQDALKVSAKSGEGVTDILEAVIARIPAPEGDRDKPLKALIIDSWFDNYVGVVMLVRVVDGRLRPKDRILFMSTEATYLCEQVGVFTPKSRAKTELAAGEVGFVIAGIKELKAAQVGDTLTRADERAREALPGFKEIKPQVFAGLYPVDSNEYDALRDALEKLHLNDASLRYEPESSQALGFGFRCGFLGLLHMDIVQERLEREYGMSLITTAPTVVYQVLLTGGEVLEIENPSKLPDPARVAEVREPIINGLDPGAAGLCRSGDHPVHAEARHAEEHAIHGTAGHAHLRAAAQRSRHGLLRSPEVGLARLRFPGLRLSRVSRRRPREARHSDQRRPGRCTVAYRSPGERKFSRARDRFENAGAHSAADVRHRGAGRDRIAHHRARDGEGTA